MRLNLPSNTVLPAMSGSIAKPATRIVSATPGRIRIRDRALRSPALLERLEAAVNCFEGVTETRGNAAAASLVLHFDLARTAVEQLESEVERALDALLRQPAADSGSKSRRRQINRLAKAGMLGSLAVSLALVAAGKKRGHAVAGALFLGALGVHLTVHRKSLLR